MTFSQTSLGFDDLDNFEKYWSDICRMSLSWHLSDVFLMIILGLQAFLEEDCRGEVFHFIYIPMICTTT